MRFPFSAHTAASFELPQEYFGRNKRAGPFLLPAPKICNANHHTPYSTPLVSHRSLFSAICIEELTEYVDNDSVEATVTFSVPGSDGRVFQYTGVAGTSAGPFSYTTEGTTTGSTINCEVTLFIKLKRECVLRKVTFRDDLPPSGKRNSKHPHHWHSSPPVNPIRRRAETALKALSGCMHDRPLATFL